MLQDDFKELGIDTKITAKNIPALLNLCNDRKAYKIRTKILCNTGCSIRGKPARSSATDASNRS